MPGPNGVITVSASFQQSNYYDRDCITLATAISASRDPASSSCGIEQALEGKKAKAVASLDRPSSGEAPSATRSCDGLASPSALVLESAKGTDSIKACPNHCP